MNLSKVKEENYEEVAIFICYMTFVMKKNIPPIGQVYCILLKAFPRINGSDAIVEKIIKSHSKIGFILDRHIDTNIEDNLDIFSYIWAECCSFKPDSFLLACVMQEFFPNICSLELAKKAERVCEEIVSMVKTSSTVYESRLNHPIVFLGSLPKYEIDLSEGTYNGEQIPNCIISRMKSISELSKGSK